MPVVPEKHPEKIQWFEDHIARFEDNATAIGTTEAEVDALAALTVAARAAYAAQQLALSVAKDKTAAALNAITAMGVKGQAIIKQVRAKAEATGDPAVYVLAGIPAPAVPSTRPAPGTPSNFLAEVGGDGALTLKWRCVNPAGATTLYQVYRRESDDQTFKFLGNAGGRKYVDTTLPAGSTKATYKIRGIRTNAAGGWATFNVFFGSTAGGATTATVAPATTTTTLKAA